MKKVLLIMLTFLFSFSLLACNEGNTDTPSEETPNQKEPNETVDGYTFEGTRTVGPFTVYNSDGSVYEEKDKEEDNPNMSLFNAIRLAGSKSTNSNKMYVLDANGLEVFRRQAKSQCWCYDGTYFVGSKSRDEAFEWSEGRKRSYVIDGQGVAFIKTGIEYYEDSDLSQNIALELFSGGYNYMFSDHGIIEADEWTTLGFGYMETYCRLSEATYMPNQDKENRPDDAWNAYIFINGAAGLSCDLGLIGVVRGGQVVWSLVRNCQSEDHKTNESKFGPSFTVLGNWEPVTTMKWDEEAGCYNGADDLFFQCWQTVDGWILKITNLRTNKVFTIDERHEGMFEGKEQYFRFLLAASYCPVVSNIWNARCGGYLRNVVFDNVKVARYDAEIGFGNYDSQKFLDFYPGTNMIYGFSQASDCASSIFGTREANGTYKSGNTYQAGDKYLSFSCYYDGGGH